MSDPVFSVIVPVYNELENLPLLYSRVSDVMNQTGEKWELIFVDDGSTDGSTDSIRELAQQPNLAHMKESVLDNYEEEAEE